MCMKGRIVVGKPGTKMTPLMSLREIVRLSARTKSTSKKTPAAGGRQLKYEYHVMTFWTFNAPRRSNCQAKVVNTRHGYRTG